MATIAATAELLELSEDSPAARERLRVIQAKSHQVDDLISDLSDRRRLAQVVDNIVQNSYKYAGTAIRVTGRLEGEALRLSLTDAGPGVDPDETGLILARGQRGRNAAGTHGQGLGLFTSAQLMERMGGRIEADLPEGGGLRLTLTLPLA